MDIPDRRSTDTPLLDPARIIATLYTLGYFFIVYLLVSHELPGGNRDAINQLLGALTIIQTAIVGFYFGGSRSAQQAQQQFAASKDKADSVIGEIAKATPIPVNDTNAAALAALKKPLPDVPTKEAIP